MLETPPSPSDALQGMIAACTDTSGKIEASLEKAVEDIAAGQSSVVSAKKLEDVRNKFKGSLATRGNALPEYLCLAFNVAHTKTKREVAPEEKLRATYAEYLQKLGCPDDAIALLAKEAAKLSRFCMRSTLAAEQVLASTRAPSEETPSEGASRG